jgi:hypothetical protein
VTTLLAGGIALVVLLALALAGARVISDIHGMRHRLDQQRRGDGAMPDLQRTQIAITRQQLAVASEQLRLTREQLAISRHLQATADATLTEVRRTRTLVSLANELARQIARLVAEIDRKQYQPPLAPSPASR